MEIWLDAHSNENERQRAVEWKRENDRIYPYTHTHTNSIIYTCRYMYQCVSPHLIRREWWWEGKKMSKRIFDGLTHAAKSLHTIYAYANTRYIVEFKLSANIIIWTIGIESYGAWPGLVHHTVYTLVDDYYDDFILHYIL